ncbi:Hypothetical predicted protein [Pelobates cultripes]|uniref:Uncharacterized protein n=1 Tax=Pelobates cultripes TaxID=61616 RepID=A0AAD1VMM8_PELCU|nr:Hypothetical predicted protein [Pelobates cultripes]
MEAPPFLGSVGKDTPYCICQDFACSGSDERIHSAASLPVSYLGRLPIRKMAAVNTEVTWGMTPRHSDCLNGPQVRRSTPLGRSYPIGLRK